MDYAMKKHVEACFEKSFEYSERLDQGLESVVPDTMPDIGRIVFVDGTVIIREKEASTDRVSLSAGVAATVLYLPEDGGVLRRLSVAMPIDINLDAPGVTAESYPVAMLGLASLDARILNPRKIVLRAAVDVRLSCWDRAELCFFRVGEDCPEAEILEETLNINPVVCVKEKTFTITEDFALPPGKPPVGEILCRRTELIPGELRAVGSKLVLKATARVTLIYAPVEPGAVESVSFETAFSQLIETDAELHSPDCAAHMLLTAEYIEQTGPSDAVNGFTAELHIVAQIICRSALSAVYAADCYSNSAALEVENYPAAVESVASRRAIRETAQGELTIPGAVAKVNACICRPGAPLITEGALKLPLTTEALYTDENGQLLRATGRFTLEAPLGEGETQATPRLISWGEPMALPGTRGLELRVPLEAELVCVERRSLEQIASIRCTPLDAPPELPSVTVLLTGEGDSLWSLAKANHSSPALIRELNDLDSREPLPGTLLLIPTVK